MVMLSGVSERILATTRMRVDIDVLKDKVRTLFELWNKDK